MSGSYVAQDLTEFSLSHSTIEFTLVMKSIILDCIPSLWFWKKRTSWTHFLNDLSTQKESYNMNFFKYFIQVLLKKHNLKLGTFVALANNVTVVYSRVPGSIPARDLCSRTTFSANLGLSSPFKMLHWRKQVKRLYFIQILNWSNWLDQFFQTYFNIKLSRVFWELFCNWTEIQLVIWL